jgi:hypothetical protein
MGMTKGGWIGLELFRQYGGCGFGSAQNSMMMKSPE